jgi:hypothetical protein
MRATEQCNFVDHANITQLDMQDGDTLEVHQEQIGGSC